MKPGLPYRDRRHAGQVLAARLGHYRGRHDLLVLALPRGGLAVAFEVAQVLQAPLDVFVVRKLGYPGHEEYAMGAIASGGVRVMNPLPGLALPARALEDAIEREQAELERREQLYRGECEAAPIHGRTVIVVDDGLATGATMRAAVQAIRRQGPQELVAAAPVGARQACESLRSQVDEVVCAAMPEPFRAVGTWYADFAQASDAEVRALLELSRQEHALSVH